MLTQIAMKQLAAKEAMKYIKDDMIVGIGTGSTVKYFIEELANSKKNLKGIISSSESSTKLLLSYNMQQQILDMNNAGELDIYVDGADQSNNHLQLIKGGGGALTREKIVASNSKEFICIVDESKHKSRFNNELALAIEVLPMARSYVAREIVKLGGAVNWRMGFTTDNHNVILDVYNLSLDTPLALESKLNNIAGVVANGIFAQRRADVLLVAHSDGSIQTIG